MIGILFHILVLFNFLFFPDLNSIFFRCALQYFVTCFHHCYDLFVYMSWISLIRRVSERQRHNWVRVSYAQRWIEAPSNQKKILVEVNKQINHSERERERGRSAARILLSESVRFQSIVNIAHPHTIDENNYTFIQICCFFWSVVIAAFRILSFDLIENKSQRTKRFLWNSNTRTHERIWNTGQGAKETESKTEGANEKFALSELLRQNVNKRKSISII